MILGIKVFAWAAVMGLSGSIFATTITFNDLSLDTPVSSQYASLGVVFNMSYGTAQIVDESIFPGSPFTGNQLWVRTTPGQPDAFLTVSFGSETVRTTVEASSISFDIADLGTNPLIVVQSYAADASLLEELFVFDTVQNMQLSVGTPAFIVILDAMSEGFLIDNVSFTTPTVFHTPEPVTMIPVGMAIAGLGVAIHRRKKSQPPSESSPQ